jgi:hypothetical protein
MIRRRRPGEWRCRLPRFDKLECTASEEPQRTTHRYAATKRYRSMQASRTQKHSRWTREENVRRYRKLLNTPLTDIERNFIERRLAEELQARSEVKGNSGPTWDS